MNVEAFVSFMVSATCLLDYAINLKLAVGQIVNFNLSSLFIHFINVYLCIVSISFQRGLELVAFLLSLTYSRILSVSFFSNKG